MKTLKELHEETARRAIEAEAVLRALEWSQTTDYLGRRYPSCPMCQEPDFAGHSSGCWLALVIGARREE